MPRLRQVPRAEAPEGIVTTMYDFIFGPDRDPVAEPGLHNGTPGNWWTVVAQSPELLAHCVSGFQFYRGDRELPVDLRELAQLRVGWAAESRFVFSQHTKACRDNGVAEEKIAAITGWQTSDVYSPAERAVLAWVDALVLQRGRASDETFVALREHLSELAVLELTYIATWYDLHAVMSRALRLELDDVDDRITELTGEGITTSLRPPPATGEAS